MVKRTSKYANLTASDLARITRERGLAKPEGMKNISEWADWLEGLDGETQAAEAAPLAAPDYDAMTRAEAVKRAQDAGMPVARNTSKAEAVDFLMAAAGISEDAQAALDHGASSPAQPGNE